MNLAEYQRAVMRVCFDLEPAARDLTLLGDETRFRMYRHMVRSRLEAMAEVAFKRARQVLGEPAFSACFARFLAEGGAKSPLIRDVTAAFGVFAQTDLTLLASAPEFVPDLVAFELAKWELAYVATRHPAVGEQGVRELDFEGKVVLNPALRQLSLAREILPFCELDPLPQVDGPYFSLLVYRPLHNDVRWWAIAPFFAGLMARFEMHAETSDETVAEAVRFVAAAQSRAVDEALLEELATDLTLAVQRGVIVGVRA